MQKWIGRQTNPSINPTAKRSKLPLPQVTRRVLVSSRGSRTSAQLTGTASRPRTSTRSGSTERTTKPSFAVGVQGKMSPTSTLQLGNDPISARNAAVVEVVVASGAVR
jgi:hypothetical protein